jgi:hypothetical protein
MSAVLIIVAILLLLLVLFLVSAIKVAREYERAIVFRLGPLSRTEGSRPLHPDPYRRPEASGIEFKAFSGEPSTVARRESSVISPGESVLLVAEEPNGDTHLCNSRTFEASRQVSWLLALAVKPGELDNFRALMKEMVESTRAESGTLSARTTGRRMPAWRRDSESSSLLAPDARRVERAYTRRDVRGKATRYPPAAPRVSRVVRGGVRED